MGDISEKKLVMIESIHIFGGSFSHFLPEIPTKHNIKETASKGNIRGPLYITKDEVSGDG